MKAMGLNKNKIITNLKTPAWPGELLSKHCFTKIIPVIIVTTKVEILPIKFIFIKLMTALVVSAATNFRLSGVFIQDRICIVVAFY